MAAAEVEARAVMAAFGKDAAPNLEQTMWEHIPLDDRHTLVVSGIGKGNAGAAASACVSKASCSCVLSVGVAGALPGPRALPLGSVVAATHCVYADEGCQTPEGFIECAALGFPVAPAPFEGNRAAVPARVLERLRPVADCCGPIATVSTCSGTDALARAIAERTGAVAEGMEGAAVAAVAARLGVPFGEVRVISNTTGDRARQVWDIKGALAKLTVVIGALRAAGPGW